MLRNSISPCISKEHLLLSNEDECKGDGDAMAAGHAR